MPHVVKVILNILSFFMTKKISLLTSIRINKPLFLGGIGSYPKSFIFSKLDSLPKWSMPRFMVITKDTSTEKILAFAKYPCILKPDRGRRGRNVVLIETEQELLRALPVKQDHILSDFYDYPYEGGLFFIRKTETIYVNLRLYKRGNKFCREITDRRISKLTQEKFEYEDITTLMSPKAKKYLTNICKKVSILEYGRFDIRIHNLSKFLKEGKSWKLLELNLGIDTIPHHTYDKRYNWRDEYNKVLKQAFT